MIGGQMKKKMRVYVDTSVFGGCEDTKFSVDSNAFFDAVRNGDIVVVISTVVLEELKPAPPAVRTILSGLPTPNVETLKDLIAAIELRDAYLEAGILTPKSMNDATHVAAATVARVDAIVSWNFKHILHLDRIRGFNRVNQEMGYASLVIIPPRGALPL
jgi:predicted nucleic acid-binding protein